MRKILVDDERPIIVARPQEELMELIAELQAENKRLRWEVTKARLRAEQLEALEALRDLKES